MTTVAELSTTHHAIDDVRMDLDRRIIALSDDEVASKDALMEIMGFVLGRLDDVMRELATVPATDMRELHAKAKIVVAGHAQQAEHSQEVCVSLAEDVMSLDQAIEVDRPTC